MGMTTNGLVLLKRMFEIERRRYLVQNKPSSKHWAVTETYLALASELDLDYQGSTAWLDRC